MSAAHDRDPHGPPLATAGFFGLDADRADAEVVITGVPFDLTCSFRRGTARGPEAMRRASHQMDHYDLDVGDLSTVPMHTHIDPTWARLSSTLAPRIDAIRIARDANKAPLVGHIDDVNRAGDEVFRYVHDATAAVLDAGQLPVLVGGDHSTSLGALVAAAEHRPSLGVLHIDAHADMREAYEGFTFSHASVLFSFTTRLPSVPVTAIGLRDMCAPEVERMDAHPRHNRVTCRDLRQARARNAMAETLRAAVRALPDNIYITWDIDGMEPRFAPGTGTPVPGGLNWDDALMLLDAIGLENKRVVGLDLVEVSAGPDATDDEAADSYDANVGARLLYKLIGTALRSRGKTPEARSG